MIATLRPTGEMVSFEKISIGEPFFYQNRFWTRTDYTAGTDLVARGNKDSCGSCAFYVTPDMVEDTAEDILGWIIVEKVEVIYE